jgi:cobalt-zinc-cadmium efflux system outer membrane protein
MINGDRNRFQKNPLALFLWLIGFSGMLIWSFPAAYAQNASFSLPELVRIAQEQHPRLRAAREQVKGASAAVRTASALPNPELEWMDGRQRARVPGAVTGSVQSWSLTQRLDMPWQRSARINAASAGLEADRAQLRAFERDLIRTVKLNYYDVLRKEAELEASIHDLQALTEIRERVAVRVKTGEAPRYDVIKADAEVLNAQKLERSARLRVDQAKAVLRNSVGLALPARFELTPESESFPDLPPLGSLQDQALQRNPDLSRAQASIERARQQLSLERSLRLPSVALRAGYDEDPEVRGTRVGVAVSIPLWDRRSGPVGEAAAQLSRLEYEQEQIRLDVHQRLEGAYQQYQISLNQVAALESGIVMQAEAALRVAEAAYRFGERGILDYLDAQRVYRNVRNELIAARYERRAALIEIETLHQE